VTREYPNKLDHVLSGPGDQASPRSLHPIFFGSFDWHSCVHGYWLLARILRSYPDLPDAPRIHALFATSLSSENVAGELAYLARPLTGTFERPYGWAWLLMLTAELSRDGDARGESWSTALRPLAEAFAARLRAFLPKAAYPVRSGTHANTAFALALALDYARQCHDGELADILTATARRWYLADVDCPAWEPSGEDFLSPCLIEAECMRRVLPAGEFAAWFTAFLPHIEQRKPSALFEPVAVSDRSDGRLAHLDGLNLSRAWCWGSLAASCPDARGDLMRETAARHLHASLPHIDTDYMGAHWLGSFALLALQAAGRSPTERPSPGATRRSGMPGGVGGAIHQHAGR
jgi:hypothetical protein